MSLKEQRERVERVTHETIEAIFCEILDEDKLFATSDEIDNFRRGLRNVARRYPIPDDGIERLSVLTDEQLQIGARDLFEPLIRQGLADLRPS